jgi:hypothetical protein
LWQGVDAISQTRAELVLPGDDYLPGFGRALRQ